MAIASLRVPISPLPKPDLSWLDSLSTAGGDIMGEFGARKSYDGLADRIGGQAPAQSQQGGFLSRLMGGGQEQQPVNQTQTMAAPVTPVSRSALQGDTYQPFIQTVRSGGLTNPYGLAAVAATGKAESGWSAQNANRTWSDPSESGQAGTAGGILSWRAERLAALQNYARRKGENPGSISPQTQGEFFLQENPQLIQSLNNAGSVEEAQQIMNNAWKFAGYDRPGGEAARRSALAQNYYSQEFANQPNGGAAAIEMVSPLEQGDGGGTPLSDGAFDDRFGPTNLPVEQAQGREGLAAALTETNANPQQVQQAQQVQQSQGGLPQTAPRGAVMQGPDGQNYQFVETPSGGGAWTRVNGYPEGQRSLPGEVADSSGSIMAPGITPVQRGGVDPSIIQYMLRDPNLREIGVKLWAANVQGQKPTEPWQFVKLADGTLARANQQSGQVERIGNFAKPGGDDEWGLNPVWGKNERGETVLGQVSKSGKFKPLDTGGFVPTPGLNNIDTGTAVITRNSKTGQVIDTTQKDLAGAEREKELGTAEGKAIVAAPGDIQAAQNALDLIESIRNDPYRERGTGATSAGNVIPNTGGYDFEQKVQQAKSGAFLTAIQQMRGMGALSNAEGQTATAAVTRMNTSMTEKGFLDALADYEKVIKQGLERAQRRLGEVSKGGRKTQTGVQWSIEE